MYTYIERYVITHIYIYIYIYLCTHKPIHVCCIYIWSRAPRPPPTPPNGLGSPPPSVVWGVVGGNPPSSFPPVVWGFVGGNPPPSFPPVVWGLVGGNPPPSPLWCGVWWGRVRAGKSWLARGGREASLVRQTIFCGRRFCSETLGCPFKCGGRPWRFLLGTIQYRAIKSVLMTSRPPIIDYTLCHILYGYTLEFILCTLDYILYTCSIYDSKTTQRRQSSSSHIASGHVGARL